jgi:hypothetical protein
MKTFILTLLTVFFCSCSPTIKKISSPEKPAKIEVAKFETLDVDKSGSISKAEYKNVEKESFLNYSEPIWAFYGVLGLVAILLVLSNFLQRNKKNG